MTEPVSLVCADDTIVAVRVVRGILDGETGPWDFPVSAIRGMGLMLIFALRANAEMQGITGKDFQDDYVRDRLDSMHQAATLVALRHDAAVAADG